MWKRFQLFASADLFTTQKFTSEEVSQTLLESEWVRIVLIRNPVLPNAVGVDVEVSIPRHLEVHGTRQIHALIEQLIQHLEYLKCLAIAGYTIDVIVDEGLWIASNILDSGTCQEDLALLSPPHTM